MGVEVVDDEWNAQVVEFGQDEAEATACREEHGGTFMIRSVFVTSWLDGPPE